MVLREKVTKAEIQLASNTVLYIPNRVSTGQYKDFSLIHNRIFGNVIKLLQQAIMGNMNGENYQQFGPI